MRTLISLNGWWGFFFRRNSRILAFTAILLVVFVTDLGGASDWPNGQLVTAKNLHYDDGITVKMDFASNQVMMISEAELLMTNKAEVLINLEDYPIHQAGAKRDQLIETVRTQLAKDGCAVLKSFLTAEGVRLLRDEADRVAPFAHASHGKTNAYFTADDPSLAVDHPCRRFFDRSNAFVPADHFKTNGALRRIHDFPAFDPFIKACLHQHDVYRYADPLADVIVNVAYAGDGFPWHFDTNNFTITLAIQSADEGGLFEYAPNIRQDGENFEAVKAVLDGVSDRVKSLALEPGDLQLFKGRYSLHRVSPLKGSTPRYVAILSYVEQPDMVGTPERVKQLYGRVLPIHLERAGLRGDSYLD